MKPVTTLASLLAITLSATAMADDRPALDILLDYASDYENDPFLTEAQMFGVQVGEDWYTVNAEPGDVTIATGTPSEPSIFFVTDIETLNRIDRGEINAMTGMAKAQSSDFAPMDMDMMEGFQPGDGFLENLLGTAFHFWTRGAPEAIPFGRGMTRVTHGTNTGIFYYQPGFRSGFFHIEAGHHVNEPESEQTNPFPTMIIVNEGWAYARINGVEMRVEAGHAYFIPAGQAHEFWLPENADHDAIGFLFMFGEGA